MCQRVFSFIKKNCDNKIPKTDNAKPEDKKLLNNLENNLHNLIDLMNKQHLNEYIKMVVGFSFDANKYFNDSEPWSVKKTDPERMKNILFAIMEQIKNISILLNPIIPIATNKVLGAMNISNQNINLDKIKDENIFDHEKELNNLEILFTKIEDDN